MDELRCARRRRARTPAVARERAGALAEPPRRRRAARTRGRAPATRPRTERRASARPCSMNGPAHAPSPSLHAAGGSRPRRRSAASACSPRRRPSSRTRRSRGCWSGRRGRRRTNERRETLRRVEELMDHQEIWRGPGAAEPRGGATAAIRASCRMPSKR